MNRSRRRSSCGRRSKGGNVGPNPRLRRDVHEAGEGGGFVVCDCRGGEAAAVAERFLGGHWG